MKKVKSYKKSKKSPLKKLDEQCLELWSKCVRERDKTCRNCNSDYRLSAHHIRTKSHQATRYSLANGMALCWSCHCLQKYQPEKFHDMVISIIGQEKYDLMKELSAPVVKYTLEDLEDRKESLEVALKHLKHDLDYDHLPH